MCEHLPGASCQQPGCLETDAFPLGIAEQFAGLVDDLARGHVDPAVAAAIVSKILRGETHKRPGDPWLP